MKFLFLFMDGVGLGPEDPETNPLAAARMPNLINFLGGKRLVAGTALLDTPRMSLRALDAVMGLEDMPQSATGQATLLTGLDVPQEIGQHYGPKPNEAVREVLHRGTIFSALSEAGYAPALLNAYPQRYFEAIESGKRLYSSIPQGVTNAGIRLKEKSDLMAGQALSADFTGEGWATYLGYEDVPVYSPTEAGHKLGQLAAEYDLAFFEYWPSDYAGHRQDRGDAINLLENFDLVLGGLLQVWRDEDGLVLLTSDHGNLEALDTRRHTMNPVPALLIGTPEMREKFNANLSSLADVAPAILQFYPGASL